MHKEELIKHLSRKNRRPQEYYRTALTEILTGIHDQLTQGKEVAFIGFGTFYTRMRKAGSAINFKTKKKMSIPAHRQVAFRPGGLLKQAVRKKK